VVVEEEDVRLMGTLMVVNILDLDHNLTAKIQMLEFIQDYQTSKFLGEALEVDVSVEIYRLEQMTNRIAFVSNIAVLVQVLLLK
jgi:hypothetical protein